MAFYTNAFASLTLVQEPTQILQLQVHTGLPSWGDFRALQQAVRVFYAKADSKKMRLCLLFDLRRLGLLIPAMVQEWIALFRELHAVTERIVVCSALVFEHKLVRDAVTLFLKTYDAARPVYACSGMDEALATLEARAKGGGAAASESAATLLQ